MSDVPMLPYAGTSGWSGTDTSRDRAYRQDHDGTTGKRQQDVLNLLSEWGEAGCTWADIAQALGVHHGIASGMLSVLHKTGKVVRLSETRGRCKVYVLPQFIAERALEDYKPNKRPSCPHCGGVL